MRQVEFAGRGETLEPRILQVLVALARKRSEVVSRESLIETCWNGVTVGEDSLNRCIYRLRKLGEASKAFEVETIAKVGYRLKPAGGPDVPDRPDTPESRQEATPARSLSSLLLRHRWKLAAVAVALLAAAVLGPWAIRNLRSVEVFAARSVAVLPFSDRNGDEGHLAAGVTDALLSRLRGVEGLTVAGGEWMPGLLAKVSDPKLLGEQLSVDHLLDGSVSRQGDRLRISARLTTASDGHIVWTRDYNLALADVFSVQDQIATAVADALSVTLDVGLQSSSQGGTRNYEAYDHYLRGLWLRNKGDPGDAVRELTEAVTLDPGYARAWSELTIAYGTVARLARTPELLAPTLEKMDEASRRAEALAPEMWFGHTARGWYFLAKNDWYNADLAHRRALEVRAVADPEFFQTEAAFANQVGRVTRARDLQAKILAIDPRYREHDVLAMHVALPRGDYAAVWAAYEASNKEQPEFNGLRESLAYWTALAEGDLDHARTILAVLAKTNPYYGRVAELLDSPDRMLAEMRGLAGAPSLGRGAYSLAALLAGQYGDEELAVDLLRKAYLGPGWAGQFQIWFPELASTRKTDGFKQFARDIGWEKMWRASGDWGDFCHPVGPDDFECR